MAAVFSFEHVAGSVAGGVRQSLGHVSKYSIGQNVLIRLGRST